MPCGGMVAPYIPANPGLGLGRMMAMLEACILHPHRQRLRLEILGAGSGGAACCVDSVSSLLRDTVGPACPKFGTLPLSHTK